MGEAKPLLTTLLSIRQMPAGKKPRSGAGAAETAPEKKKSGAIKPTASQDAKKRKKPNTTSYSSYIYKVLKQVHPDTGISKKAMVVMDSFVHDIFERLATEAGRLARYNSKH